MVARTTGDSRKANSEDGGEVVGQRDERRKWPRLDVALKIRLKPLVVEGEGVNDRFFYTKNISTGGLLFDSDLSEAAGEGGIFDVEISMPLAKYGFTSSRRLEARGKVCRVEHTAKSDDASSVALEFMAPPRFVTP